MYLLAVTQKSGTKCKDLFAVGHRALVDRWEVLHSLRAAGSARPGIIVRHYCER